MENSDTHTPAPSDQGNAADDALHSGFQQLIQHNATATPYSHPQQGPVDLISRMGSAPPSRYTSPAPQQSAMSTYEHHTPIQHSSPYPPPSYPQVYQQGYSMENSAYPPLQEMGPPATPHSSYNTPAASPPSEIMTTRSGRTVLRSHGAPALGPRSSRVGKASPKPKSRKSKRKRGSDIYGADGSKNEVILEAPLSELVKNITNVTDTDINAYVNRSPEDRRREVAKSKDGKVKRPMNAFMLYRKAFQNRTKEWKKHDNHQVISQLCGKSWSMEDPSFKQYFEDWAVVERNNHKDAFPDYKFAPAKAKKKILNKQEPDSDDESEILESYNHLDYSLPTSRSASRARNPYDPDGDYLPPGARGSVGAYSYHSPSPVAHHQRLPYQAHQSSFQYTNPGKPRPADYGSGLGQGQYYQMTSEFARQVYPHPHQIPAYGGVQQVPAFVENVYMNKASSPASYHGSPMDGYGELMGSAYPPPPGQMSHHHPHHHPQQHMQHPPPLEHQIDPSLMSNQPLGAPPDGLESVGSMVDLEAGYSLDADLGAGGAAPHQQFESAYLTPAANDTPASAGMGSENDPSATWSDDLAAGAMDEAKLSDDWEATLGGDHLGSIDDYLGTTDSPGG
ncbi:hypothetical protein F5Y15DRAFT_79210 [Xylariaceae sp. FL0016]|nr:hypothetical protein F5Y15DRAFT_79210 [Xylariaceae sp. FL0016]